MAKTERTVTSTDDSEAKAEPSKVGYGNAQGEAGAEPDSEPKKSYRLILDQEIEAGVEELERPSRGLVLSGLSAGLDIGFSLLLIAVVTHLAEGELSRPVFEILRANAYSIGFIFVIFGRSELFTEHTTLAALPALAGRATVMQVLRLWVLVYAGNLVGSWLFGALVAVIGPALGITSPAALEEIALDLIDHRAWVILASGVLAGWMMGLLTWLVTAARDTISQIFFVWSVTSAIGLCHLHHCVVGSAELAAAVVASDAVGVAAAARTLALATVGNAVGGVIFVALLKYAHASRPARGRG